MSFALDVTILLYASDTNSPFFKQASTFIGDCITKRDPFYLGWPTVMG
jgi:hypothetical protein